MSLALPLTTLTMMAMTGVLAAVTGCDRAQPPAPPAESAGRPAPPSQSPATPASSEPSAPASAGAASPLPGGWQGVVPDRLCVTSGNLVPLDAARFTVDAPTFRAVTAAPGDARARLQFTYLGPTSTTRALGSGAIRQQLGLKLKAQDPCNLVYVMWRIAPEQKLVVSLKRNPGQRTSAECGNRGYTNVKPAKTSPLPPLAPNSSHVLSAELGEATLVVRVDDVPVWEGPLDADALALAGPIGVRTDNVRLEAQLAGAASGALGPCRASRASRDGESE